MDLLPILFLILITLSGLKLSFYQLFRCETLLIGSKTDQKSDRLLTDNTRKMHEKEFIFTAINLNHQIWDWKWFFTLFSLKITWLVFRNNIEKTIFSFYCIRYIRWSLFDAWQNNLNLYFELSFQLWKPKTNLLILQTQRASPWIIDHDQ